MMDCGAPWHLFGPLLTAQPQPHNHHHAQPQWVRPKETYGIEVDGFQLALHFPGPDVAELPLRIALHRRQLVSLFVSPCRCACGVFVGGVWLVVLAGWWIMPVRSPLIPLPCTPTPTPPKTTPPEPAADPQEAHPGAGQAPQTPPGREARDDRGRLVRGHPAAGVVRPPPPGVGGHGCGGGKAPGAPAWGEGGVPADVAAGGAERQGGRWVFVGGLGGLVVSVRGRCLNDLTC